MIGGAGTLRAVDEDANGLTPPLEDVRTAFSDISKKMPQEAAKGETIQIGEKSTQNLCAGSSMGPSPLAWPWPTLLPAACLPCLGAGATPCFASRSPPGASLRRRPRRPHR